MYFDSFTDFIAMGGHGTFVWMAYACFLMVIIWNLVSPAIRRRQVLESARRYWRRVDAESQSTESPS
jgi:heme exporter protein D